MYRRRRTFVTPLKLNIMAAAKVSVEVMSFGPVFSIQRTTLKGTTRIAFESG